MNASAASQFIVLPSANPLTTQIDSGGIWHVSIFVLGLALLGGLFWKLRKFAWPLRLFLFYVLSYAFYLLEFPADHFGLYTAAYQATTGQVFAEIVLASLAVVYFHKEIIRALPFIVGAELILLWTYGIGIFAANSFDLAFCAAAAPFLPNLLIAAVALTALTHHGGTAVVILAAMGFVLALRKKDHRISAAIGVAVWALVVLRGRSFGDAESRLAEYFKMFSGWWVSPKQVLLGVGPGTFMWKSLEHDRFQGVMFLQLHSDWLQILWELGAVGFGLAGAVFITAVRNAWENTRLTLAIVGCGVFALTYHPLRYPLSAVLTALTIFLSCRKGSYPLRRS